MMKKTFTLIAIMLLLATQMFAQKLSYQAVIRNSNNELVYNATLTVEVSILGPSQNVLYSQTIQNVTSNQNGLITIQIGDDSPAWRAINWSDATIRSVIKDGTTTVATVNSAVSAVPLAIQTLNGSNGERVQADWEETDQNSPAFIQNKPTIPAAPDLSGYVTNEQLQNAGYLRYESQSLSDVAAYGNDAGSRQLKGLADPTDAQDAVTLSYLTTQLNALQQQLAQLGQVVAAQQAVIDSLTNGGGGNAPVTPTTFTCGDNLIDGSNSYTTHQFGSQCWMTQNLRKVNYPEILSACPDGWHLPNNDDWNTLGSSLTSSSVNFDNGDYWASNTMPWQDADGNSFTLFISPASVRSNSVSITNNGIACEVNDALNGDCRINDYALSVRCVREETSGSDTTGGPTTAQAPSVTSSSADLISENEATLFAYVSNPDNVTITSKGFEYKVSGSANYTTAECYVNSQDDNGFGIYAPLTGLTAGTEYTYRAFVTTAEGTIYGSEGTFTTTEDSASCSSLGDLIGQHGNVLRFPINDYSADKINASASGYLVYYNSHDNIWSPCLEVTKSAYDNLVNINDSLVFECVIQFNMLQDYAGQTVKIYPYLILVGCNDDRSWIPSYSVDLVVPTINTSASVGDILLEDNSWVSPNDFDTTSMTAKGVIFHVDETGQHGWAVNLQDEGQSASFQWSTIEEDIADLPNCYDSNTDTAGYQNTRAILQAGDATTYPAANTVSFVDGWYLPAIGQLAVLMQNFEDVNASLGRVNGIAIDGFWYYSSSEIGSSGAWSVYYDEHIINWGRKSTSLKVRSVRSF